MPSDYDLTYEQAKNHPQVKRVIEYLKERLELDARFGMNHREVHVNPADIVMLKIGSFGPLKVVEDYNTPRGMIDLR